MGQKFQRMCFCGELYYSRSYRRTTCSVQCRTLQLYIRMLLKAHPEQAQRTLESIVMGHNPKQALPSIQEPATPVLTEDEEYAIFKEKIAARKAAAPSQLMNRLAPARRR